MLKEGLTWVGVGGGGLHDQKRGEVHHAGALRAVRFSSSPPKELLPPPLPSPRPHLGGMQGY